MTQDNLVFSIQGMEDGGRFPVENTGRGANQSPALTLANLSPDAQTLLITLEDWSHPIKRFTHWVIWNIPAAASIPGAIPAGRTPSMLHGAVQGVAYGFHRYAGPKPPRGKRHQYVLTVYALDTALALGASSTKRRVLRQASGHMIQQGQICGYFE